MVARSLVVVTALAVLVSCSRATLPYTPAEQPRGARVSAAYQVVGERLRIEIDTGGKRLEQVWIMKPDGASVPPQAVDNPPAPTGWSPSIGIGVGGGTWGGHGGVGSGVSVGIPVGGGSTRVEGNTVAWFPLSAAGPAPWQTYIKIADVTPVTIVVGR